MSVVQRIRTGVARDLAAVRSFVTGPADVAWGESVFGVGNEWSPGKYGDYLATSNAVYACVTLRATNLAGLPLKLYRVTATGEHDEITAHPALELLTRVNPYWTFGRLVSMTEQSLSVWGQAFWFLSRGGRGGRPQEIWWARPDRVKVVPHPAEYISHFEYETNGETIRFERDETVWFRYPNPIDQYAGLSPLAAARLAADTNSAAMRSNYNIFRNGVMASSLIAPKPGQNLTEEQAKSLTTQMNRRFAGIDNAHKVGVLRFDVDVKQLNMTPHDAEFLGALKWTLEDVCRAYGVPVDKIGGERTYQNVEEADRAFWADTMKPEAAFLAEEITEQLLPLFGGQNIIARFDLSGIDVLHEAESARWEREAGQLDRGAITINEWRDDRGLDPVPWGDVVWLPSTHMPIDSPEKPAPVLPPALAAGGNTPESSEDAPESTERTYTADTTRTIPYGSPEHRQRWQRAVDRAEPWEGLVRAEVTRLFNDQKQSVLARLRQRGARIAEDAALDPFDRGRWIRSFRIAMRPVIERIVTESAELQADDLGFALVFDVADPFVARAIERQVQRFAEQVNGTTWDALRAAISEGIGEGDDIEQIAARVEAVMGDRIRSDGETIARTETTAASTMGTEASWEQSGVVRGKQWLAALDGRTRQTHVEAHGQTVALGGVFTVGAASGSGPGMMSSARESVNCRCTLVPVLDTEGQ